MEKNHTGRIIEGIGGYYTVVDGNEKHVCRARGNFRASNIIPMVGDYVEYNKSSNETSGYITKIINRKNNLMRPMVANIDLLLVVVAAKDPEPDLKLVDTLLINATKLDIDVCLIVNKSDLAEDVANDFINMYPHIDEKVAVSCHTRKGIEDVIKICKDKTICFAGQSGVGKSSILNCMLPDANLQVGEISVKTKRGKHTTRQANLIEFQGGYVVDSPGFSMLELDLIEPTEIKDYYPDFVELQHECKFNGCLHYKEPKCAVLKAVDNGSINKDRHNRYKRIYEEMIERWKRRYD